MDNSISIIGGDLRIVNLAKILLNEGFKIITYGMEKIDFLNKENSLEKAVEKSKIVISSVPLSKDGENVLCEFSEQKILISDLQKNLTSKKFIAGKIPNIIKNDENIESYDILENEEFAILNAIATAEGAIQIAMEETTKTLNGSKILVMGFGRIGKILAKMLQGLGAKVYCEARKKSDLAYIEAYGYVPIDLQNLDESLNQFDIIFNNIPSLILDKNKLDLLKREVLIIDLASKPGGVDFEYAKQNNLKVIWALGLPGKVAPVSAAEYIKKVIMGIIKN